MPDFFRWQAIEITAIAIIFCQAFSLFFLYFPASIIPGYSDIIQHNRLVYENKPYFREESIS
jgi:hypothetical protein